MKLGWLLGFAPHMPEAAVGSEYGIHDVAWCGVDSSVTALYVYRPSYKQRDQSVVVGL